MTAGAGKTQLGENVTVKTPPKQTLYLLTCIVFPKWKHKLNNRKIIAVDLKQDYLTFYHIKASHKNNKYVFYTG